MTIQDCLKKLGDLLSDELEVAKKKNDQEYFEVIMFMIKNVRLSKEMIKSFEEKK